ncbi:ABC transporter permease [Rhizobium sp. BK376]|uniref:ABC transporter permease n=1 Tax=Rhizobium sp. BK376 TaxID=2512149 RepID=UPI0010479EAE|nr:ABC transporter permease [Rhizobium sp. BK376]TCR74074.1 amino acid ABC transporter membrane protein 2 (PAAT family) [Rhizobium sp. BK376]
MINIGAISEAGSLLPGGVVLTLLLTVAPLAAGFLLSIPLALIRSSKPTVSSTIVWAYTYAFRGTPLLVQLFLVYYGLAQLQLVRNSALWLLFRDPFWCAFIAFTLNSAAHTTEILAGGLRAIPKGQMEAATSLGLSRSQAFCLIQFPLAFRIVLPAYTNEVIGMLKASSLASTITLLEVTGLARQLVAATFAPYEVFIVAGLIYLGLTFVVSGLASRLERALNPLARSPSPSKASKTNRRLGLPALRTASDRPANRTGNGTR